MSKSTEQGNRLLPQMISLLLGGVISVVSALLLLFVASAALTGGILPQNKELQIALVVCLISAFIGGMYSSRCWGRKRLFAGLLTGAVFFLILATVGWIGYSAVVMSESGIGIFICCICGGGVAGFLGGTRKKKTGKRSRR